MTPDKKLKGSRALVAALEHEGCDVLFGYPGGVAIPFYDALYDAKNLRHVLVRHEQGAAHAADGYARATGKVGVCTATSGPGATNLVTGIATAYLDSSPLVAITWQVRSDLIGTDAFQEADITGITLPIVKHSYLVKERRRAAADRPRGVPHRLHRAARPGGHRHPGRRRARRGRLPRRRHDRPARLPADVQGPHQADPGRRQGHQRGRSGPCSTSAGAPSPPTRRAEILKLAELRRLPVATTLMALGAFPETHELSMGMLGMHGTVTANYAVHECDLLINLGARFDDRVTGKLTAFAPHAKIIHADVDPAEIGKNVAAAHPDRRRRQARRRRAGQGAPGHGVDARADRRVAGAHRASARRSSRCTTRTPRTASSRRSWWSRRSTASPAHDAIICTDVGQHQMWATQYYTYHLPAPVHQLRRPRHDGLRPAGQHRRQDRPFRTSTVIDISGDGGFQMTMQELATAVSDDVPVVVCILNNGYLGMVRQWQDLFWNKRYSFTCVEKQPDFKLLAEAFGAVGMTVTEKDEIEPALREAIACGRPAVIDFRTSAEENVYPMVPAGQEITEMIGGPIAKGRSKS